MDQVKKYCIVDCERPDGDFEASVVPVKWVVNGKLHCPADVKKEAAASRAYADIDPSWPEPISCVIVKCFDSYESARLVLANASDTDGLRSDKELGRGARRKRKSVRLQSLEVDGELDNVCVKSKGSKAARKDEKQVLPPPPLSKYPKAGMKIPRKEDKKVLPPPPLSKYPKAGMKIARKDEKKVLPSAPLSKNPKAGMTILSTLRDLQEKKSDGPSNTCRQSRNGYESGGSSEDSPSPTSKKTKHALFASLSQDSDSDLNDDGNDNQLHLSFPSSILEHTSFGGGGNSSSGEHSLAKSKGRLTVSPEREMSQTNNAVISPCSSPAASECSIFEGESSLAKSKGRLTASPEREMSQINNAVISPCSSPAASECSIFEGVDENYTFTNQATNGNSAAKSDMGDAPVRKRPLSEILTGLKASLSNINSRSADFSGNSTLVLDKGGKVSNGKPISKSFEGHRVQKGYSGSCAGQKSGTSSSHMPSSFSCKPSGNSSQVLDRRGNETDRIPIKNLTPIHSRDSADQYKAVLKKQQLILTRLNEMDRKIDLILGYVGAGDNAPKPEGWPKEIPLPGKIELYEFEEILQDADTYDFAVCYFGVVVGMGPDPAGMAGEVCTKLFKKELAKMLNWAGSDQKKGIKNMKVGKLIIDAVGKRYEGRFKKSSVTSAISVWLRNRA